MTTENTIQVGAESIVPEKYKNSFFKKMEQDEKEVEAGLEQMRNPQGAENSAEKSAESAEKLPQDENLAPEEKTFKQRYGDLRRYSQQQLQQKETEAKELRRQLEEATQGKIALPKTEAELEEWAKQYPDVAAIIDTYAQKRASEAFKKADAKFAEVETLKRSSAKEKAEAELLRMHPDFDTIRDNQGFHDWAAEQPEYIQKALYENETDARSAARAIDLYKADMGISKKSSKQSKEDAQEGVGKVNTGKPSEPGKETKGVFYASQIKKMSDKEFEANYDAIMQAQVSGNIVDDIRGVR